MSASQFVRIFLLSALCLHPAAAQQKPIRIIDLRGTSAGSGESLGSIMALTASHHGFGILAHSHNRKSRLLISDLNGKVRAIAPLPHASGANWAGTDPAGNVFLLLRSRSPSGGLEQRLVGYSRSASQIEEKELPMLLQEAAFSEHGAVGLTDAGRPVLLNDPHLKPFPLLAALSHPMVRYLPNGRVVVLDGITASFFVFNRTLATLVSSGAVGERELAEPLSKISPKYRSRTVLINDFVTLPSGNMILNVASGVKTSEGAFLLEIDGRGDKVRAWRVELPAFPELRTAHNPEGNIGPAMLESVGQRVFLADPRGIIAEYELND